MTYRVLSEGLNQKEPFTPFVGSDSPERLLNNAAKLSLRGPEEIPPPAAG
jgi:hypothetical protein